jgi:menaquinone-9 beta-reductase
LGEFYDLICVGGGLAGSALAKVMAEHGAKVLVIEGTEFFVDRIRGEATHSWGAAEAKKLGIYDLILQARGVEVRWLHRHLLPTRSPPLDAIAATGHHLPRLCFSYPDLQELLIRAASDAGVQIRRGATALTCVLGASPEITFIDHGHLEHARARMVIGADGRNSRARKWIRAPYRDEPAKTMIAGTLFRGLRIPEDAEYSVTNPASGRRLILVPQREGIVRAYLAWHVTVDLPRLRGAGDIQRFLAESVIAGADPEILASANHEGSLATFEGAETWVEHPYARGIALVGDAAAVSDPTWGQGLALTMRDVRVLAEQLIKNDDWDAAGDAYATEHDEYHRIMRNVNNWSTDLFLAQGPAAQARRDRALPLIANDKSRIPLHHLAGPDAPADEVVRRRLFGEA